MYVRFGSEADLEVDLHRRPLRANSGPQRESASPVRVQVKKSYVEKARRLSWKEDATVMQRFGALKRQHIDAALGAKSLPGTDYRVYTIE